MSILVSSRREFLGSAAATAGAFAFSRPGFAQPAATDPLASPGAALPAVLGANDRIRFGVIGTGGMGTGHLGSLVGRAKDDNIQVAAVCDVFQRRLTRAKGICGGDGYGDYRKLLDRKDVDAVLIATPDHWHAKISLDALDAGKHVYCEKPMTHTVEQAIEVRNAVRRRKQVFQVGPNGTANDSYWKAGEAIRDGRIGKVTWAHASYNRNEKVCLFNRHPEPVDPAVGPQADGENRVDWDLWLGHEFGLAPKIPWNAEHFFHFRKFWPYNGGVATDLLYHKLAPVLIAVAGPDGEYPLRVNANGGQYVEKDGRDIPDTFLMTVDYPGEWSVFLVSTLTNDSQLSERIYGKHGTMDVGGEVILRANGKMGEEFRAKNEGKDEVRIPLQPRRDLEGNFIDAIRGKGPVHCSVELGAATMVAIKMGVESYRQRLTMKWDAAGERLVS